MKLIHVSFAYGDKVTPALFERFPTLEAFAEARPLAQSGIVNVSRYRSRSLPVAGALLKPEDKGEEQMTLI